MKLPVLVRDSLCLLGAAGILAGAAHIWHPHRPPLYQTEEKAAEGEITIKDAQAAAAPPPPGGVVWIDARRRVEFEKGSIPGALLLNEYEWNDLMEPAMAVLSESLDKKVIVYCDAMKCSASKEVAKRIQEFFPEPSHVLVLRGGWPAWQAAGAGKK